LNTCTHVYVIGRDGNIEIVELKNLTQEIKSRGIGNDFTLVSNFVFIIGIRVQVYQVSIRQLWIRTNYF